MSGKDSFLVDKEWVQGRGNSTGKYTEEQNSRVYVKKPRLLGIGRASITTEGDEAMNVSRTRIIQGRIYYN